MAGDQTFFGTRDVMKTVTLTIRISRLLPLHVKIGVAIIRFGAYVSGMTQNIEVE